MPHFLSLLRSSSDKDASAAATAATAGAKGAAAAATLSVGPDGNHGENV